MHGGYLNNGNEKTNITYNWLTENNKDKKLQLRDH